MKKTISKTGDDEGRKKLSVNGRFLGAKKPRGRSRWAAAGL
jgi:hypothetical protein